MRLQVVERECINHSGIYSGLKYVPQLRLRQERSQHEHSDGVQVL